MKQFNFLFYGDITFGKGSIDGIHNILKNEKYNNLGCVIDHSLLGLPLIKRLIKSLKKDKHIKIIECGITESTHEKLEEKRLSSKDIDLINAFPVSLKLLNRSVSLPIAINMVDNFPTKIRETLMSVLK